MFKDYVRDDLAGYSYNMKYPPNVEKYGTIFGGYSTASREVLFHDFAVFCYDLRFKYNDKYYYCVNCYDYVADCDENFNEEYQRFEDANQYIEQFEINGRKLIDMIDELEEVEQI